LKNLKESFLNIDYKGMVVISDRDKELLRVFQEVFPKSYHSNCSQYIADNIQRQFGLAYRNLFWGTAYAYTEQGFKDAMDKIQKEKQLTYKYINSIPHMTWAQYAFPIPRFGHITSNITESINSL
jgi:hypothetical protein